MALSPQQPNTSSAKSALDGTSHPCVLMVRATTQTARNVLLGPWDNEKGKRQKSSFLNRMRISAAILKLLSDQIMFLAFSFLLVNN